MSKMNILVITQIFPQPDDVGDNQPTKTVQYFARDWARDGHKVVVIHCPSKFPLIFYCVPRFIQEIAAGRVSTMLPTVSSRRKLFRKEEGFKVVRMPMNKLYPGRAFSPKAMKKYSEQICTLLDKKGFVPDIVLGHFANPGLELTVQVARHYQAASSIVFHHDCLESTIDKYRIRELIENVGAVGARSIVEAKDMQKILDLERQPFVCFSGVPDDAVKACDKTVTKHVFDAGVNYLTVGSLLKRKHMESVIKAFAEINNGSIKRNLEIIGGGSEEEKLKELSFALQQNDSIQFEREMPRELILDRMKKAQIFTLISSGEAFGMVYLEAMLQGCITIASFGGGFDGIIKNGENGFLCRAGDHEMLAGIYKKIESMSSEERNRIGQAAVETAIQFSETNVARKYLSDVRKINHMK
jgi:glycosyltransferase involved in cell wall biosynthesis